MRLDIKIDSCIRYLLKFKPGTVLDLGCGKGRNALFLAQNGFDVTGADISETAVKAFLDRAKELNLEVRGIVADIRNFKFEHKYDFAISIYTLHFLEKAKIDLVIQNIKSHTNENGINVLAVFTEDNPAKIFPYLFKKNELKEYYSDWDVLEYAENNIIEKLEQTHKHAVAILIAKKSS